MAGTEHYCTGYETTFHGAWEARDGGDGGDAGPSVLFRIGVNAGGEGCYAQLNVMTPPGVAPYELPVSRPRRGTATPGLFATGRPSSRSTPGTEPWSGVRAGARREPASFSRGPRPSGSHRHRHRPPHGGSAGTGSGRGTFRGCRSRSTCVSPPPKRVACRAAYRRSSWQRPSRAGFMARCWCFAGATVTSAWSWTRGATRSSTPTTRAGSPASTVCPDGPSDSCAAPEVRIPARESGSSRSGASHRNRRGRGQGRGPGVVGAAGSMPIPSFGGKLPSRAPESPGR